MREARAVRFACLLVFCCFALAVDAAARKPQRDSSHECMPFEERETDKSAEAEESRCSTDVCDVVRCHLSAANHSRLAIDGAFCDPMSFGRNLANAIQRLLV